MNNANEITSADGRWRLLFASPFRSVSRQKASGLVSLAWAETFEFRTLPSQTNRIAELLGSTNATVNRLEQVARAGTVSSDQKERTGKSNRFLKYASLVLERQPPNSQAFCRHALPYRRS
jgi:hypothetical protein